MATAQFVQNSFDQDPAIGVEGSQARTTPSDDIGSGVASSRKLVSIAVTAVNSTLYSVTVNGTLFSFTSDGSATTAEITVGLRDAINLGAEPVTASGADTPLLIESKTDGVFGMDFSDTTPANARLTGDFVAVLSANLVATTLVAQGQQIPFGVAVCRDERSADNDAVRLPRQATDVTSTLFKGIVLADTAKTANVVSNKQVFNRNVMVPVLKHGYAYVRVEEAVNKGDQAFIRFASGAGGTQLGAFRKSADTASAAASPNCTYETTAAAAGLAIVRCDR